VVRDLQLFLSGASRHDGDGGSRSIRTLLELQVAIAPYASTLSLLQSLYRDLAQCQHYHTTAIRSFMARAPTIDDGNADAAHGGDVLQCSSPSASVSGDDEQQQALHRVAVDGWSLASSFLSVLYRRVCEHQIMRSVELPTMLFLFFSSLLPFIEHLDRSLDRHIADPLFLRTEQYVSKQPSNVRE
jgi:hypothetical protein